MRITGIATQGRRGIIFDDYTPEYDLKYKQSSYSGWFSYLSTSRAYAGTQVRKSSPFANDYRCTKFFFAYNVGMF